MKGEEKGNYCSELTAHNVVRERWGKGEVCGFGLNGSNRCLKTEGNVFCVISGATAVPSPVLALLGHLQPWGQLWAPPDQTLRG